MQGLQAKVGEDAFVVSVYPRGEKWAATIYDCQLGSLNSNDMDTPEHLESAAETARDWGLEKALELWKQRGGTVPQKPVNPWYAKEFGDESEFVWRG